MKFRRTVSSVLVSAFLAIVVLLAVLHFHASTYGIEKVRQIVQSLIPQGDHGLEITMDRMDSTLMKGVRIHGIHLRCDDGTDAVRVGSADVSLSILGLVTSALGIGSPDANIVISDVSVIINDLTMDRILSFINDLTGQNEQGGDGDSKSGGKTPFGKVNLSLSLNGLSVLVDYKGVRAVSRNINAAMEVGRLFKFKSADLNIPKVSAKLKALSDEIEVNDIRLSMDEDMVVSLSLEDASFGDLVKIKELSALGSVYDAVLSAAVYLQSAVLDGEEYGYDASLDGLTLNANYGLDEGDLSLRADIEQADGCVQESDLDASVKSLVLSGSYGKEGGLSLKILSGDADVTMGEYGIDSKGLAGDLSLNVDNLSSLGQITLINGNVRGLEGFGLKKLGTSFLTLDYSYSPASSAARVRASVSGSSESALVRDFSFALDANALLDGDFNLSSVDVHADDIRMNAIRDSASVSLSIDGKGSLHGELSSSSDFSASVSYGSHSLDISLFLSDFRPFEYKGLYETALEALGVVTNETAFDGNIVANVGFSKPFGDFISSVLAFSPGQLPENMGLTDMAETGRLSINTAVRDLKVGESSHSGAVTIESTMENGVANIGSLAVTTGDLRLSYEGSFELAELIPDGKLSLRSVSDGSELAGAVFSHAKGMRTYEFSLQSPLVEDTTVSGSVDWQNLNRIVAAIDVKAPILGDEPLSMDAVVSASPLSLELSGDRLSLNVAMAEDTVRMDGNIRDLVIHATEVLSIDLNSELEASYNTKTSEYVVSLTGFSARFSNGMGLGFDLDFANSGMRVSRLSILESSGSHDLDGSFDFTFSDLSSIMRGDTSSLDGVMDFTSKSGTSHLHGSVTDNQFYLDFRYRPGDQESLDIGVTVLGQRSSTFFASADLAWGNSNRFDFKAMYDDKVLTIYDSAGKMGNTNVNGIELVVDFAQMFLKGSMQLLNETVFSTGELMRQGATITLDSKVESIANGLVQLVSGQDYSVDFTMGISDVILADGYKVEDTMIDISLSNSIVYLSGNMLNGSFDLDSGYLDIAIDKDFIFGFKAKGYIGREMDVLVSDLSFPLPLLNQFMDSPAFAFRDGLIEGDLMVIGTMPNPSIYGMAYCQSYEMTLFYLPDQIISAKNVAMSFNDHVISISKTPISGYSEADGRYFYGDVALQFVMQESGFESLDFKLNIDKNTPIDFWMPLAGDFEMDIRGDVTGSIEFEITPGHPKFVADIGVSSTLISFRIDEELPSWYTAESEYEDVGTMDMDITITTGHDIEFYYPEKDNSFINFTLAEDKTVHMVMEDNKIKMDGGFALKTGQVYYFQNDFIIREGSVDLTERKYSGSNSDLPLVLNLTADITDYDADGNKVIISLILQNATLDNISPRFSSTPMKDENEILAMLGQSVLSSSSLDQSLSLYSLASFAATATDALTRVGILESNKSYSISGIVRNSLGLDIFSARSNIISNVLIDALPGDYAGKDDVSMLARYLDGTSIFAGKYITNDWFIKIRLMLKAETNINNTSDLGHFLAKDLILDTEVSLDWDTPMGTVSIFTNPHELSVFDILDTIGFSVTKQIQF